MDSGCFVDVIDTVLPSGFVQVAFNLGDSQWKLKTGDSFHASPSLELLGQLKSPASFKITGHNVALGINFYPHTAHYFIKDSSTYFTEQVVDLEAIFGSEVYLIQEQLLETSSLEKRIAILEKYLLEEIASLSDGGTKLDILDFIISNVHSHPSMGTVQGIARKTGYSERYIERLFREFVGLSPKEYLNITRFQNSLKYLNNQNASYASVSYACGYADQSHFIREFKKYAGVTPSGYRKEAFPSATIIL